MTNLAYIFLGLIAGALSGLIGIGGGIVLVPSLIMFFGFQQHMAQGTTLAAMIPPVGLLAAYVYYKNGHVNTLAAMLIAAGFLFGALGGANIANMIGKEALQKIFGVLLLIIGLKFLLQSGGK